MNGIQVFKNTNVELPKKCKKKTLFSVENKVFLSFGGDKRDRTADLLNAMDFGPASHGFLYKKQQILDKTTDKTFHYTSIGI